jgi:hypothetical protein
VIVASKSWLLSTNADEIVASQQLFEILKSFKDSCFSELYTDQTLDFHDEYDEMTDEEDSTNEEESTDEEKNIDDYDENQYSDIQNNFTLEEMEDIVEWVDQHPNYKIASIKHQFRKVKYMYYITRFREYIKTNGTKLQKLKQIKEFMWDEFYMKRAIEKEAVHDSDLELFAIQKAKELDWDNFKASPSFIAVFKKEYRISSRRFNKLITRISSTRKICTLKGM